MSEAVSSEMNALIGVVRAGIGVGEFPDIGKCDDAVFQRLGAWHKLLPLVARVLANRDADEQMRDFWRDTLRRAAAEAERKLAWQRELCAAFEGAQIPVLPLRGLLLSRALYGEMHMRPLADIDLLVPPECAARAMDILTERGLKPPLPLSPVQREACVRFRAECAFLDEGGRNAVDLHWRAMPACFELVPDGELWKGSGRTELGGYVFRDVRPAHQLLLLCSHGAKHGWDRLGHLADLGAALRRYSEDVVLEAQRAAESGPRGRLWRFGLLLTREVLGVYPPPELTGDLEEGVLGPFVADAKRKLLASQAVGGTGGREREWIRVWLTDARDRRAYWRETIWAPSLIELSAVQFPRWMWGLYRMLRLARLAWRAVARATHAG